MSKLAELTRENQERLSLRLRHHFRQQGLVYVGFLSIIGYLTLGYYKVENELRDSRSAVYRMAQETAVHGCATLDMPTSIVVIGNSYPDIRAALDRTVGDLDKFTSELDKANHANKKGVISPSYHAGL